MSEREPITAELRAAMGTDHFFCDAGGLTFARNLTITQAEFDRLCDAIDAVHAALERENAELRERVAVLDNQSGNMHDGWVRLPLDADGVPIRVGDEVVDELDESTAPRKVTSIHLADDDWWVYIGGIGRHPSRYRHHHAPTVEDVLREMHAELDEVTALYVGEAIDSDERDRDEARIFAEYAKRLALAGDAE